MTQVSLSMARSPMRDGTANDDLASLLQEFAGTRGSLRASRNAQERLYRSLGKDLDAFARWLTRANDELAAPAVQEAWIKIFTSAPHYDPAKASVKTWAKRITFQCVQDEMRSYYKRNKLLAPVAPPSHGEGPDDDLEHADLLANLACPAPHSEELVLRDEVQRAVADCIDVLPDGDGPNYRLAMQLCLDEDLTQTDMLQILAANSIEHRDINLYQVQGWIRQARVRMQDCLGKKLGWQKKERKP
ncbi:MAG: sigma-70 family RNA polymerase sigma factor [Pseudomonadota bacterium]|nr:sigma-70 family RNA polymerase sigma factor [Pseudomonadota bacterium]